MGDEEAGWSVGWWVRGRLRGWRGGRWRRRRWWRISLRAEAAGACAGSALGTLIDDVRFRAEDGVTLRRLVLGIRHRRRRICAGSWVWDDAR